MLLLFSDPRMGLGLALKAAVSARERTDFVDVHGKGAVRFVDDPVISHALNMARSRVSANRVSSCRGGLLQTHCPFGLAQYGTDDSGCEDHRSNHEQSTDNLLVQGARAMIAARVVSGGMHLSDPILSAAGVRALT